MNLRSLAPLCTVALVACTSNYDFAKARLPNGEWDLAKLTADLNASGERELFDFSWIPLIRMHQLSFSPSSPAYPSGYQFREVSAAGPLFFGINLDQRYVDGKGELVESQAATSVGWMLIYNSQHEKIATDHGIRTTKGWRTLIFFGKSSFEYLAAEPKTPQS